MATVKILGCELSDEIQQPIQLVILVTICKTDCLEILFTNQKFNICFPINLKSFEKISKKHRGYLKNND